MVRQWRGSGEELRFWLGRCLVGNQNATLSFVVIHTRTSKAILLSYGDVEAIGTSMQSKLNFKLDIAGDNPDTEVVLSLAAKKGLDDAAGFVRSRATGKTADAELYTALAAAQAKAGLNDKAIGNFRRALELDPQNPGCHSHLGYMCFAANEFLEAKRLFESAMDLGREVEVDCFLACLCSLHVGDLRDALGSGQNLVRNWPANPQNVKLLGEALKRSGHPDFEFVAAKEAAISCLALGQPDHALAFAKRASNLNPSDGFACSLVAEAQRGLRSYDDAELAIRRSIELGEETARTWNMLGLIYQESCRIAEALNAFGVAGRLDPTDPLPPGNAVMAMHYSPHHTAGQIRGAINIYAKTASAGAIAKTHSSTRQMRTPLKVGLLSGNFQRHPALLLSLCGLEQVDNQMLQLVAYCNGGRRDDFTRRLKNICHTWRDIGPNSDDEVAGIIEADNIDILIDMSGSTQGRPSVIARKPAPVQVKWVGGLYNTTGMKSVDWLLADAAEVPKGDDCHYTESVYRMPDGYVLYEPPEYAPDVIPSPCIDRQSVTFCSFNNPAKINPVIVGVWSHIMAKVQNSRIILKGSGFTSATARSLVRGWFSDHGIEQDRVTLEPPCGHRKLLDTYNRSDIALDTWPYSGGLTTCEALWMGNPVVTMPGPTFAGRHSASHLTNIGRTEWIAESEGQYVEKAVSLARDQDALCETRRTLRQEVAASPLCDAERFARNFEKALIEMYEAS